MIFPRKIGISMPDVIKDTFETTEHEYLVGCRCDDAGGPIYNREVDQNGNKLPPVVVNHFDIVGYIDLTTGTQARSNGWMSFTTDFPDYNNKTQEEQRILYENSKKDRCLFQKNKIYRIKAYPPVSCPDRPFFNNEAHMQGMYVTEILSDDEQNEYLQNLLDIWYNPVTIHSEELGDMVLDKELMWYCTKKDWRRKPIDISLKIHDENEDVSAGLAILEQFWKKKSAWDKKLRSFAANQLLELANDWLDDDDAEEWTEESFAKALENSALTMNTDGRFEMWYNDGDIFLGHSIVVSGNVKDGAKGAKMVG
ncbi:DUF2262 domain-containing protein [Ruminococcus sp. HUN007]|uniref:DUF2262 domain-containing protein n=1 Tax=Ruminococcus sp. HUN007 TaxID=1514668 RepID=UPI0005D28619|nr:DUF2262 domain-containing protein [Ruminococcus sp. HUN007]